MDRDSRLTLILASVFIAVFNIVFFAAAGTKHPASVWLAYVCIHLAYLALVATPRLVRGGSGSAVFGFSLGAVSFAFFLAELALGVIIILLRQENITFSLISQALLAGAWAAVLLSHLRANERTAESLERREDEIAFVRGCASRLRLLPGKAGDPQADRALERLYDQMRASPSRSRPEVRDLENWMINRVTDLETVVYQGDVRGVLSICGEISGALEQRNRSL